MINFAPAGQGKQQLDSCNYPALRDIVLLAFFF